MNSFALLMTLLMALLGILIAHQWHKKGKKDSLKELYDNKEISEEVYNKYFNKIK